MEKFIGFQCSVCGAQFDKDYKGYVCEKDSGNLDVVLDYEGIKQKGTGNIILEEEKSIWRYLPLLPVDDPGYENTPFRQVGFTPMYRQRKLQDKFGMQDLWIKDESRNPTASFKDRASALVIARAMEIGTKVIVTASTGNAGAALAGMAAAVDYKAVIFAPKSAPEAKIAQLLVYGAEVLLVDGNYDDAFDLSIAASNEFGWYCRNTGYNPFTLEGKKTAAFEIWEFLNEYYPNYFGREINVFVSVGDGNIISGIHKGFKDLFAIGMLDKFPRIFGVQSVGSSAIANAFESGSEKIMPVKANTIADSISVDMPRDGLRALRAVTQTQGKYVKVEDDEIIKSIGELGEIGVFAEPAGATSYAGFKIALENGYINKDSITIIINTGNGLKDIKSAMKAVEKAIVIKPTLGDVKKALKFA